MGKDKTDICVDGIHVMLQQKANHRSIVIPTCHMHRRTLVLIICIYVAKELVHQHLNKGGLSSVKCAMQWDKTDTPNSPMMGLTVLA